MLYLIWVILGWHVLTASIVLGFTSSSHTKFLALKKNNWNIFSYLLLAFQIAILISQGSVLEFYEIRRFYFLFHWKLDKCGSYQQLEKETCFGNDRHKNTLPLKTIKNFNFSFYIQTKMAEFGLSIVQFLIYTKVKYVFWIRRRSFMFVIFW